MANETCIVKYFGRDVIIRNKNSPLIVESVKELNSIIEVISQGTYKRVDAKWSGIRDDLISLSNCLMNPDGAVKRFKMEILKEAIIPYINKMKSRLVIDSDRFHQIQILLSICNPSETTVSSTCSVADTLLEIDKIVLKIKSKSGWFTSELGESLEHASEKQWRPIIRDNQVALRSIGSKLVVIGMIEVIGRSLLLLWPIYLLSLDIITVVKDIEEKKGLTPVVTIKIIKSILLIFLVMKLLVILSMLNGIGYMCLIVGSGALFVSMSDQLIKSSVHVLSPNMLMLETMLDKVYSIENNLSVLLGAHKIQSTMLNTGTLNPSIPSQGP